MINMQHTQAGGSLVELGVPFRATKHNAEASSKDLEMMEDEVPSHAMCSLHLWHAIAGQHLA